MPRYKLTLEYDGAGLAGWQRQRQAPSVQQLLEDAVEKFCGQACEVVGAGRTDAGVHATAQVAHVDLPKEYDPYNIRQGINFHLVPELRVVVLDAQHVPEDFHARFSAVGRSYLYRIVSRPSRLALDRDRAWHLAESLDAAAMHDAAQLLLGHHDFSTFRDSRCQAKSAIKTLDRLDVIVAFGTCSYPKLAAARQMREGGARSTGVYTDVHEDASTPPTSKMPAAVEFNEIHIIAEARSFLHHQVRNMVGSLRLIGNGKWTKDDLNAALEARDRSRGGETAPPQGLYLTGVKYIS